MANNLLLIEEALVVVVEGSVQGLEDGVHALPAHLRLSPALCNVDKNDLEENFKRPFKRIVSTHTEGREELTENGELEVRCLERRVEEKEEQRQTRRETTHPPGRRRRNFRGHGAPWRLSRCMRAEPRTSKTSRLSSSCIQIQIDLKKRLVGFQRRQCSHLSDEFFIRRHQSTGDVKSVNR